MLIYGLLLFLSIILTIAVIFFIISQNSFIKILTGNYITSIVVVIIVTSSFLPSYSTYIDIAFIYVLLGFIASIGFLRYYIQIKAKQLDE